MNKKISPTYGEMMEFVRIKLEECGALTSTKSNRVFPFRSRFDHTKRVFRWAERLLTREAADEKTVLTAAVFHDVGYAVPDAVSHGEGSAVLCREYLTDAGFEPQWTKQVVCLARRHSDKNAPAESLSPELRVLMDADQLDEVGAMSVLWDAMAEGREASPTYEGTFLRIERTFASLEGRCGSLKTKTGNDLYQEKIELIRHFLLSLSDELGIIRKGE